MVCLAAAAAGQVQVNVPDKVITPRFTGVGLHRKPGIKWRVVAVDSSGNASASAECECGQ